MSSPYSLATGVLALTTLIRCIDTPSPAESATNMSTMPTLGQPTVALLVANLHPDGRIDISAARTTTTLYTDATSPYLGALLDTPMLGPTTPLVGKANTAQPTGTQLSGGALAPPLASNANTARQTGAQLSGGALAPPLAGNTNTVRPTGTQLSDGAPRPSSDGAPLGGIIVSHPGLTQPLLVKLQWGSIGEGGGDVIDRWQNGSVIWRAPYFGPATRYTIARLVPEPALRLATAQVAP